MLQRGHLASSRPVAQASGRRRGYLRAECFNVELAVASFECSVGHLLSTVEKATGTRRRWTEIPRSRNATRVKRSPSLGALLLADDVIEWRAHNPYAGRAGEGGLERCAKPVPTPR